MATRADMIAEIASDLERSETTIFSQKISNAIRSYQGERFWFNETRSSTFSTVAAQQDYTYGTDITDEFMELDGIYLSFGTSIIELDLVDYREIEVLRGTNSPTGVPVRAAFINNTLALYPCPDAAYAVSLAGLVKKDGPADDSVADNVWMNEGYDLIKSRTKVELYAVVYRDTEGAAIERAAEAMYLAELKAKSGNKMGTGRIRPTQF